MPPVLVDGCDDSPNEVKYVTKNEKEADGVRDEEEERKGEKEADWSEEVVVEEVWRRSTEELHDEDREERRTILLLRLLWIEPKLRKAKSKKDTTSMPSNFFRFAYGILLKNKELLGSMST